MTMRLRNLFRRSLGHSLGFWALLSASACFDGEELTEGLKCTQKSHCGGDLECLGGFCVDPNDDGCDTDPSVCSMGSASLTVGSPDSGVPATDDGAASMTAAMTTASTTPVEPTCGQQYESCFESGCCDFGVCVNHGDGTATCRAQCNIGTECDTCCCVQLETGGNACVDTAYCGQEAQCLGGCASPGSACYGDYDCCNGGRCLLNAGNWYSCFKPCTYPTDCVSGCCNYNATIGSNICEAC